MSTCTVIRQQPTVRYRMYTHAFIASLLVASLFVVGSHRPTQLIYSDKRDEKMSSQKNRGGLAPLQAKMG